ncbi:hypothetical protein OHA04_27325 [Streptomyces sp. NBC_01590]|uniref:hypothetical protein n=1 Tax=Streptomyces sp. NBC_01590 TaxID=2975887 RepID=UPI0038632088
MARRRPRSELPPGGLLDWTSSQHWSQQARPCRYCGRPTQLRDSRRTPAHKVCAETALIRQTAEAAAAYHQNGIL